MSLSSMLQPGLLQKGRKKDRVEEMGKRSEMQSRQTGPQETAGAIRRSAGAGQHTAEFNQDQKATL